MNHLQQDNLNPRLQLVAIPPLRPKATTEKENAVVTASSPSIGLSTGSGIRRRNGELLRYGETIDSFFAIPSINNPGQYRTLCQNVVDNPENALYWGLLFDHAEENNVSKTDLIRLYRRATSRLTSSDNHPDENRVSIWLRYAACLRDSGFEKDATLTLKHIATSFPDRINGMAKFYLLQAQLLASPDEQRKILQEGIRKNAQPKTDIERALQLLEETSLKRATVTETNPTITKRSRIEEDDNSNMDTSLEGSLDFSEEQRDERNQTVESKGSIRFQLAPLGKTSVAQVTESCSEKNDKSNAVTETKKLDPRHGCLINERRTTQADITNKQENATNSATKIDSKSLQIPDFRHQKGAPETTRKVNQASRTPNKSGSIRTTPKTQKLLAGIQNNRTGSKRPPLRRLGIQGKPERVDPLANQDVMENSDDYTGHVDSKQNGSILVVNAVMNTPCKVVVPKLDLSYMWAWDPDKRNHHITTPATKTNSSLKATGNRSREPLLGKIEETPSLSLSETSNPTVSHSNNSKEGETNSKISQNVNSGENRQPGKKSDGRPCNNQRENGGSSQKLEETDSEKKILSKICLDFLPLVSEENMIRVNNIPYAKLGVIGKGGSCKVYRALSQDGNVVAIKKVKLERLDKKQIEGYANEINLLKKLRGNPAIIQMVDSEVDLQRMSIFMVMEAGEADLNHVLQKQATISDTSGERRLNMNFIRLTWYQMLVAVNAIHEEKIIHGDLKPANFLFVRGGLKLIDFGIAKAIQSDDTTNIYRESQIGTLNYMSPESILDSGTCKHGQRMKCGRVRENGLIVLPLHVTLFELISCSFGPSRRIFGP
jgi:tRNA A-37 threonylcarbamoyl transferase component Bud32